MGGGSDRRPNSPLEYCMKDQVSEVLGHHRGLGPRTSPTGWDLPVVHRIREVTTRTVWNDTSLARSDRHTVKKKRVNFDFLDNFELLFLDNHG
jgi:hypothetical protein